MNEKLSFDEMIEKVINDIKKFIGGIDEFEKIEEFTLDEVCNISVNVLNLMAESVIEKEVYLTTIQEDTKEDK